MAQAGAPAGDGRGRAVRIGAAMREIATHGEAEVGPPGRSETPRGARPALPRHPIRKRGRINASSSRCSGLALPPGRQVQASFWR